MFALDFISITFIWLAFVIVTGDIKIKEKIKEEDAYLLLPVSLLYNFYITRMPFYPISGQRFVMPYPYVLSQLFRQLPCPNRFSSVYFRFIIATSVYPNVSFHWVSPLKPFVFFYYSKRISVAKLLFMEGCLFNFLFNDIF